ncbi:MAG: hydrogenase formation protein HypD [Dehalococcoidia bacterium]|nr:hydrogenase formation protein HypD [Dehalococcoidia bacterium]
MRERSAAVKYIDEYRDGESGKRLLQSLRTKVSGGPCLRFMEVCGTHTVSVFRSGIRSALPEQIKLLSGPGCPVCVTAQRDIDKSIELAARPNTVLVTYGDMIKVPGTRANLQVERAKGADIRVVYSPADALGICEANPDKNVVFFGIGFETTTPPIALVVKEALRRNLVNFFLLSVHKVMPPPLEALLQEGVVAIDGLLLPGHVSTIIGARPYDFIAEKYCVPAVISGFEPLDILQSIHMLVDQIHESRAGIEIQYSRVVKPEGNRLAQKAVVEVFEACDANWRGLGVIPLSGLKLRAKYDRFDAEQAFDLDVGYSRDPAGCSCGEILRGAISPLECKLFANGCTPDHPIGPCMVSSEGTCAAYYLYGEWQKTGVE